MKPDKKTRSVLVSTSILILLILFCGNASSQITTEPRLMRTPAIHDDTMVFSYAGDLWVAKVGAESAARRLTSHPGVEIRPKISRDGKWVAFTGAYDGSNAIYLIPMEGGNPRRLTYEATSPNPLGWTADGKIAYASSAGNFVDQRRLWFVDTNGNLPVRTPIAEVSEASFFADGRTMAYTRGNHIDFNWRLYRGGKHGRISLYDFVTNTFSELPGQREQNFFPMAVGRSVFYISDKKLGTLNLYRYDINTKQETQLTRYTDMNIRWTNTDGKSIIWERDGYLEVYDIASGKVARQSPRILVDKLQTRPSLRQFGDNISATSISPSGTRVAVEARGEIFSVPIKPGDTRNMTRTSGVRERVPAWSPDGNSIAYISDASGESEVYIQPQLGGDSIRLTQANGTMTFTSLRWSPDSKLLELRTHSSDLYVLDVTTRQLTHVVKTRFSDAPSDWSPDSRWLAFIDYSQNRFGSVHLYEVATRRLEKVTDGYYSDNAITFDLNGKYLYLNSSRTFRPGFGRFEYSLRVDNTERIYVIPLSKDTTNPLRAANNEEPEAKSSAVNAPSGSTGNINIDFQGLASRIIPLPMPAGIYPTIVGANGGVIYVSRDPATSHLTVGRFDLGKREPQTIYSGSISSLSFNPARTQMAVIQGGQLNVLDVKVGSTPERVDTGGIQAIIAPRQEWRQIFREAWRYARDTFYDPNMRGLNWTEVGRRYEGYLSSVSHRSDLNYVISLMLLELGTSHTVIQGGDFGPGSSPISTGQLGADYEAVGDRVRFAKIYYGEGFEDTRRGPLGEPGYRVEEGEYLLEIDGQPVTVHSHPDTLLIGKADRFVKLTVNNKPSLEGARHVRVKTLTSETRLRYVEWTVANRKYVEKMSEGRIGYIHLPNALHEGAAEFIRGFYSQIGKEAIIIDDRWNAGGFLIQQLLLDTLARRVNLGLQYRNEADETVMPVFEGPKAMLINEYAGSAGDALAWTFRDLKLGPLIGRRTAGAGIGLKDGLTFVDGGVVAVPAVGIYDRRNHQLAYENIGVEPDIEVDRRPDLVAQGEDPQLDAAVKYLMEQLQKIKPREPRKEIPQVAPAGRVGSSNN